MADDKVREAVNVIARAAVCNAADHEFCNEVTWSNYPDLGEHDWQDVLAEVDKIRNGINPPSEVFESAYQFLAGRAEDDTWSTENEGQTILGVVGDTEEPEEDDVPVLTVEQDQRVSALYHARSLVETSTRAAFTGGPSRSVDADAMMAVANYIVTGMLP